MEKVRKHIVYLGYVQGVGVRYRAAEAARQFGVTGWVRNCSDGSVEMEAEGTVRDLEDMMLAIEKNPWAAIENVRVHNIPLQNDSSFHIK